MRTSYEKPDNVSIGDDTPLEKKINFPTPTTKEAFVYRPIPTQNRVPIVKRENVRNKTSPQFVMGCDVDYNGGVINFLLEKSDAHIIVDRFGTIPN